MVVNVFISAVTTDTLSRKEAVAWVNDTLKSHLTKVEEMSTGAAYCQLTHYLFREGINLKKVKFNPRNEPDILSNWKILTTSWKALGIDKPVDVERLKKGKFQDNMEFLQWFYKFFNANLTMIDEDYDAVGARSGEDLPALKGPGGVARPPPARAAAPVARPAAVPVAAPVKAAAPKPVSTAATTIGSMKPNQDAVVKELRKKLEEKEEQNAEWAQTARDMEEERNHYYDILRKVETLMSELELSGATSLDISLLKRAIYGETEGEPVELEAQDTTKTNGAEEEEAETF